MNRLLDQLPKDYQRLCEAGTKGKPHRQQHKGNPFKITLEVRLPRNRRLVIIEEPDTVEQESKLSVVIDAAFDAMERRLGRTGEHRRREPLAPGTEENRALVARLFVGQG
jgi:hypothetical protein